MLVFDLNNDGVISTTPGSNGQGGDSKKRISFETEYGEYTLYKSKKSFKKAKRCAEKSGGYLAEIETYDEGVALFDAISGLLTKKDLKKTTAKKNAGGASYVWLGGSDKKKEGVWEWGYSGNKISTNRYDWGSGLLGKEPDNYMKEQNHLAMGLETWPRGYGWGEGFGNGGQWNDISGKNKIYFIVESTFPLTVI